MNRLLSCSVATPTVSWLVLLVAVLHNFSAVSAQTVVINYTDRGWYIPTRYNEPSNLNYVVGDLRGTPCFDCDNDIRNFFVFDLAGVTQPIAAAKLALSVSGGRDIAGYNSPGPSENYELHDVVTPIATFLDGSGGVAAHTDLGSGVVYGSRTMTEADNFGGVVEIELNSSAIGAMNATHGLFALGGSITTLDNVANNEYTFGHTGLITFVTELRLTLVPEPSTLVLLGIGAISLLGYRKAKTHG